MKISRMKTGDFGKLRAFFDLEVGGFTIKGFKIVEGSNGLFTSMPSQQDKDGNYNDTVWADKDTRQKLNELAISHYDQEKHPMPINNAKQSGGMSEASRLQNSNSYADKDEMPF